jgi:hypothetical protein
VVHGLVEVAARGADTVQFGSASVSELLWVWRGRWLCQLRMVAGRQTGSRPMRRSAPGIWPRATYARMVDGATLRNAATSWVVHQSSGRDSATGFRLQRSRCLAASGALGPDDCHREAALSCFVDDIGCATVSACWLAIPDGK